MAQRPIVFVQPPASFENRAPCLDDKQFGLGILANAAWLRTRGFATKGVHIPLMLHGGVPPDQAITSVLEARPLLIAIGMNWVHFSSGAIETATRIRQRDARATIVVGGQHAGLFADEIARQHADVIDGVIRGEAELPLLAIASALREGHEIPGGIPGFHDGVHASVPPEVVRPIDALPTYSYTLIEPPPLQRDVAALSTTRGACPRRCAWCIEPVVGRIQGRNKLEFHSARRIADQVEALREEGISRFTIQDNFFIGGDQMLMALSDELCRRNLRPDHLNVFAHPDSYSRAGLEALAVCCTLASIDYGIETGSVRVAALNRRHLDPDATVEAIASALDSGVEPYSWWMAGLPGEDEAAIAETEQLISRTMSAGGIPRWVSPLILFPRTPIHEDPERFGVRTLFRDFDDYARFSRISLAEAVMFSESIAHETTQARREEITAAALRLRRHIAANLHILEAAYTGRVRKPDLVVVEARVRQSFF